LRRLAFVTHSYFLPQFILLIMQKDKATEGLPSSGAMEVEYFVLDDLHGELGNIEMAVFFFVCLFNATRIHGRKLGK